MNREEIPWVKLIWEKYYPNGKLPSHTKKGSFGGVIFWTCSIPFKELAFVSVSDGHTYLLWDDMWLERIPSQSFPELYSFTKNKNISIEKAKRLPYLHHLFHIPLSEEAFHQYIQLQDLLESLPTSAEFDVWSYIWNIPCFTAAKAYKVLTGHREIHPAFRWLWKSSCQPNHKSCLLALATWQN